MPKAPPTPNLPALLPSWLLSLRADRKSEQTVKVYGDGVRFYLRSCERVEAAPLERASLRGWVTELMDGATRPATARARQHAVRRFTAWLAEEGELPTDPFLGMTAPKARHRRRRAAHRRPAPGTAAGLHPPKGATPAVSPRHRRDEAIPRLMLETGARAGEVVGRHVADLDLPGGTAVIRRGKGGRGRIVPFGPRTAQALDRYLRVRAYHRLRPAVNRRVVRGRTAQPG